jgi:hypothetical protein
MSTLRKKIAEALEGDFLDLREISQLFGIKEKEVLDHLNHIEKSEHHRGFTVEPASCQQCEGAPGSRGHIFICHDFFDGSSIRKLDNPNLRRVNA